MGDFSFPPGEIDILPFRVEGRLARVLGVHDARLAVIEGSAGSLPTLECPLPSPMQNDVTLVVRVHAANGIPLAAAAVALRSGDRMLHARDLTLLAMEGYGHLAPADRRAVESRVWSRRAYATATAS